MTHPDSFPLRIGDDERRLAIDALRRHMADGRISADEFEDRLGAVWGARTGVELVEVMRDLPALPPPEPGERRRPPTKRSVAVFGGARRNGRWRVHGETSAIAFFGGVDLDLRQAEIEGPEARIKAFACFGGVEVIVPPGYEVELTGFSLFGSRDTKLRGQIHVPGAPLIRVRGIAFFGSITVTDKVPRFLRKRDRALPAATAALSRPTAAPRVASAAAALEGTVTIMFTDIKDSTAMTERLGDVRAAELIRRHNELISRTVHEHDGRVVKTQGDGVMVCFNGAWRALSCAIAIQRTLAEHNPANPDQPMEVRIGLHTGEAVRDGEDYIGRTVIVAARVAAHAEPGQILVSSLLKELAASAGEFSFGRPYELELKGIAASQLVYPVAWEPGVTA